MKIAQLLIISSLILATSCDIDWTGGAIGVIKMVIIRKILRLSQTLNKG